MMDELLEYINGNEHLKFIVSLDNNEVTPMLYSCTEWGDLYSELGNFGIYGIHSLQLLHIQHMLLSIIIW